MKKINLVIFLLSALLLSLVACAKTDNYMFVFEDFNDVVVYNKDNEKVSLEGIFIKSLESDDVIPVTYDMVENGGDTNSIGQKELNLIYKDVKQTISYTVYYKVDFLVDGSVFDTKYILDINELELPSETPDVLGFVSWGEIPTTIEDNLEIEAIIAANQEPDRPNINVLSATYGDTLADITLPKNSIGKWVFVDNLNTSVGSVGRKQFDVKFIPNDPLTYREVEDEVIIEVSPKEVEIKVNKTSYVYTGEEITLEYELSTTDDLNVVLFNTTKTDIGTYNYSITIDEENYQGRIQGTWEIKPKDVVVKIENINITYDQLTNLKEPEYIVEGLDEEEIKKLNITIKPLTIINVGSYQYEVNYNSNPNYNIIVEGGNLVVNKGKINPTDPTLATLEYGDIFTNEAIGEVNSGRWEVVEEKVLNQIGTNKITLKFVPTDQNNYETLTKEFTFEVKKRNLKFVNVKNVFSYNGQVQTLTYEFNDLVFNDDYPNVNITGVYSSKDVINVPSVTLIIDSLYYEGKLETSFAVTPADITIIGDKYNLTYSENLVVPEAKVEIIGDYYNLDELKYVVNTPKVNGVGTYYYEIIVENNPNYNITKVNGELIIEPAYYEEDMLEGFPILNLVYGDVLTNNNILGGDPFGKWKLLNEGEIINSIPYEVEYEFIPNNPNYKTTIFKTSYDVAKKEVNISVINDEFTYDTKEHKVILEIAQDELVNLTDTYSFKGNNNYINAGQYEYVINIDSIYYKGQIKGILTIEEANAEIILPNKEMKFGDNIPNINEEEITINGLYKGDILNYTIVKPTNVNKANEVYYYDVIDNDPNYKINYKAGTLKVLPGDYKSELIIPEISNAIYGNSYSDLLLVGGSTDGKWIILESEKNKYVNSINDNEIILVFVPNSSNYEKVKVKTTFSARKRKVVIKPVETTFTYNGEVIKPDYEVEGLVLSDAKPKASYIVKDNKELLNAGKYVVTYTIDSLVYEGEITFEAEILKAKPSYVIPTDLTAVYNDKLSTIVLPSGFSFTNADLIINSCPSYDTTLIYTPTDINNYEIINNIPVQIEVLKAKTIIELEKRSFKYYLNYNSIDLLKNEISSLIKVNRNEGLDYSLTYYLNGKEVADLNQLGEYKVVITYKETINYNEASIEVLVTITDKISTLTATYGDMLNDIVLPTVINGKYEIITPDFQILKTGDNAYTIDLRFIPNDGSSVIEQSVSLNVNKKKVNIIIEENEFIYDGNSHNIKYRIDGTINNDDILTSVNGNVSEINVVNKKIVLSLNDINYYADNVETNLVITPKVIETTISDIYIKYMEEARKLDFTNILNEVIENDELYLSYELNYKAGYDCGEYVYKIIYNNDNYLIKINNNNGVKLIVEKIEPSINPSIYGATYGDSYKSLMDKIVNEDISGTFTLLDEDGVVKDINNNMLVSFTPDDQTNYLNIDNLNIEFIANKKIISIVLDEDTPTSYTYDRLEKAYKTYQLEGLVNDDTSSSIGVNITISGLNYGGNELINADTYNVVYEIDSKYYEGNIEYQVIIKPKELRYVYKNAGTITYNPNLTAEEIPDYKELTLYKDKSGLSDIIAGDEVNYEIIKPTPKDIINYYDENPYVGSSNSLKNIYDIIIDNPNYILKCVSSYGSSSNYGIYLSVKAADYEDIFGEITNLPTIENELTYGITNLKDIILVGGDKGGTWSLSSTYGKLESRNIKLTFTPDCGGCYKKVTKEIVVDWNKGKLALNYIQTNFEYSGKEHTILYELTGFVNDDSMESTDKFKILGNVVKTEQGIYPVTFTILSDYYELVQEYKTNLVIDKAVMKINIDGNVSNPSISNYEFTSYFDKGNLNEGGEYELKYAPSVYDIPVNITIDNVDMGEITGEKTFAIASSGKHELIFKYEGNENVDPFEYHYSVTLYLAEVSTSTTMKSNSGTPYASLEEAIEASAGFAGSKTYIYVYNNAEITKDLIIPANVELYLPHESMLEYNPYDATDKNDFDLEDLKENPNNIINTAGEINPERYLTITIKEGVTLTINGTLTIGAKRSKGGYGKQAIQGQVYDKCSEVINNGTIILNGSLTVTGYLSGSGKLEVKANAKVYEMFAVYGWRGGSNASGVYTNEKIVPFSEYQMHNISIETKIEGGAVYNGIASVYASSRWTSTNYPLIGEGAILEPEEGSYIIKTYDIETDETTLSLYGNIKDNYGQLKVAGVNISTENIYFGISYNLNIIIKEGATFNCNEYYKLLPGAYVEVEKGAVMNLAGQIIVYKDWQDLGYGGNHDTYKKGSYLYPVTENAKFVVNGTLNVTGTLAGIVHSNEVGAILNLAEASSLEISSVEAYNSTTLGFGDSVITSIEHLFAYNVEATNITIDWSKITLGEAPSELERYKLAKNIYYWNGTNWAN